MTASQPERIKREWWVLRVPGAAFFGYSRSAVLQKYDRWLHHTPATIAQHRQRRAARQPGDNTSPGAA